MIQIFFSDNFYVLFYQGVLRPIASAMEQRCDLDATKELARAPPSGRFGAEGSALLMLENAQTSSSYLVCKAMGMLPAHLAQSQELLQI